MNSVTQTTTTYPSVTITLRGQKPYAINLDEFKSSEVFSAAEIGLIDDLEQSFTTVDATNSKLKWDICFFICQVLRSKLLEETRDESELTLLFQFEDELTILLQGILPSGELAADVLEGCERQFLPKQEILQNKVAAVYAMFAKLHEEVSQMEDACIKLIQRDFSALHHRMQAHSQNRMHQLPELYNQVSQLSMSVRQQNEQLTAATEKVKSSALRLCALKTKLDTLATECHALLREAS